MHVLYRAILHDSIRDIVHSVSNDMGKTFSEYERISNDNWVINGQTFSKRDMVSGIASRHCQITSVDNNITIVWNENFSTGNHSSSQIGLEVRNADGKDPVKKFITPETGNATFPVIKAINKNSVLVAYTETMKDKDVVKYKVVAL